MPRLTRRSFLKTLLSCTGAAAAAPVLGRLLPAGAEGGRNVETASAPSWRTPPAPIASFDREAEADVCVVGGGVSGAAACRELAEEGFDVLLLEKNREADRPPRGGQLAALNAALALEKGAEEISLPEFLGEYTRRTRGEAHPGLIRTFARESGRNTDWYLDVLTGAEKERFFRDGA